MPKKILFLLLVVLTGVLILVLNSDSTSTSAEDGHLEPSASPSPLAENEHSAATSIAITRNPLGDGVSPGERSELYLAAPDLDSPATAKLVVRLLDGDGKPATGAEGWLGFSWQANDKPTVFYPNDDGRVVFLIETSADGRVKNRLSFGGALWQRQGLNINSLAPGETRDLGDFFLIPAGAIKGKVVDHHGKPVQSAKVVLSPQKSPDFYSLYRTESATTDQDGNYKFESLSSGNWEISAAVTGLRASPAQELKIIGGKRLTHDINLEPGLSIAGFVFDPAGKPLAGARVKLFRQQDLGQENLFWAGESAIQSVMDGLEVGPDGSFQMSGLSGDGKDGIASEAPGYSQARLTDIQAGSGLVITLNKTLSLTGRVFDSNGQPAPMVDLQLNHDSGTHTINYPSQSDGNGRFEFNDLEKSLWRLHASSHLGRASIDIDLHDLDGEIEVQLRAGSKLSVRVVNSAGNSIEDGVVSVHEHPLEDSRAAPSMRTFGISFEEDGIGVKRVTDENGLAAFLGLSGDLTVSASGKGYIDKQEKFKLEVDAQKELTMELEQGATLTVELRGVDGLPITRTDVVLSPTAFSDSRSEHYKGMNQSTDALGKATFTSLVPGDYIIQFGDNAGGSYQWNENLQEFVFAAPETGELVTLHGGDELNHLITVDKQAVLTVTVLVDGRPLAGANVSLEPIADNGSFSPNFSRYGASANITDGVGKISLKPVTPGTYDLGARRRENSPVTSMRISLAAGAQQQTIELAYGRILGTLQDVSGSLGGASVVLEKTREPGPNNETSEGERRSFSSSIVSSIFDINPFVPGETTTATENGGDFEFMDVAEGWYVVKARAQGHSDWESSPFHHPGQGVIDIGTRILDSAATLSGKVTYSSRESNDGFFFLLLRLEHNSGSNFSTRHTLVSDHGSYQFDNLPRGTYRLSLDGNSAIKWTGEWFELGHGETTKDITIP